MHVRRWQVAETFVPVRDRERRQKFVRDLRRALGKKARITSSTAGVTVKGDLELKAVLRLDAMAAEVSDWVRSSRKSP